MTASQVFTTWRVNDPVLVKRDLSKKLSPARAK